VKELYVMPINDRNKLGENGKKYFLDNFDRGMLLNKLEKIMNIQSDREVR